MLSKTSYFIKRGANHVGLTEVIKTRNLNYVVGFQNIIHARQVMYNLHPEPVLQLERGQSKEVNMRTGDDLTSPMIVDMESKLYTPKANGNTMNPMHDGGYHMDQMETSDLCLFPLSKNLGVIIPHQILYEDNRHIVFNSWVLEPCYNTKLFDL